MARFGTSELEAAVQYLDAARVIWREDSRALGLAVPRFVAEERISSHWQERWTGIYK
jgi:hypothetical protein